MSYDRQLQRKAFENCVSRMRANYGKEKFSNEKCDLIWEELRDFSPKQIRNVCDVVMGESSYAPNLNVFRDKASILREKIRNWEREKERNEAHDFWEGTFHPEEVASIVQTIRLRLQGKVTDEEYRQFQEILLNASRGAA